MNFPYVYIFSDNKGETHIQYKNIKGSSKRYAPNISNINLSKHFDCNNFQLMNFPKKWKSGWHTTPYKQWIFILSGKSKIIVSDGNYCVFTPGSIMLIEDMNSLGHLTEILGEDVNCLSIKVE